MRPALGSASVKTVSLEKRPETSLEEIKCVCETLLALPQPNISKSCDHRDLEFQIPTGTVADDHPPPLPPPSLARARFS